MAESNSPTRSRTSSSESEGSVKLNEQAQSLPVINGKLHLTLDNFESDDVPSDYPFVLTSPRSLASCKHFGVRPVDLLPFRIEDARRQLELEGDFSFEALTLLREAEEERREILDKCRQLRDEWIEEDEKRFKSSQQLSPTSGSSSGSEEGEVLDSSYETSSDRDRNRKANFATRPFLKLSEEVQDFLDTHSQHTDNTGSIASHYSASDRPEADQSFEEDDNFLETSSDSDSVIHRLSDPFQRENQINEIHEGTFRLKKSGNCLDLSNFNLEDSSQYRNRSQRPSVTFSESLILESHPSTRKSSSNRAARVFQNPYGPPLYFHARPIIMNPLQTNINAIGNNNNYITAKGKKKAKRIKKLLTSNLNVSPALMTSQIIDVDDCCPDSEDSCQKQFLEDNSLTKIRWKIRSSSGFRPSDKTSRLMESVNLKLENAKNSRINLSKCEINLEKMELSLHDRRILERLQLKRARDAAVEERAHVQNLVWREENQHLEKEKSLFEATWRKKVEQKRAQEAFLNEQRLIEARKLFLESQDLLKRLIREKDERTRQFVENAQRRKVENLNELRSSEESKRLAVETALEELLARDTQYRKELRSHIESRIAAAEIRRRNYQEKVKENICVLNDFYFDRHRKGFESVEKSMSGKVSLVKKEMEEKLAKVSSNSLKERIIHKLRMERALKSEKARKLKQELDEALDKWRKQVLEVQAKSIRDAEKRAQVFLNQRKLRLSSMSRRRQERHAEALRKAQIEDHVQDKQKWQNIMEKRKKFELWSTERYSAMEKSRINAQKMANLRHAIKYLNNPDTFDKRVAMANLEAKKEEIKEYFV